MAGLIQTRDTVRQIVGHVHFQPADYRKIQRPVLVFPLFGVVHDRVHQLDLVMDHRLPLGVAPLRVDLA